MKVILAVWGLLVIGVFGAKKPNLLFIFADDLAYDCVGFMGNKEVKTPNLDKLSQRGTVFTHAYNSGAWNGAVCVASRTMLWTGRQVWRAEATALQKTVENEGFLPQVISNAGYETYFSGKWHVGSGDLTKSVFNHLGSLVTPGMPKTKDNTVYKRKFIKGVPDWDPTDKSQKGFWEGGKHWSEVLTDDSKEFFKKVALSDKPFFMSLCFNAPHDPRQAPKRFQEMYPYESVRVPKSFLPAYPYKIGSNRVRDEKLAPFPRTEYSVQVNRSEYYALITHMDEQIGKMLEMLEQTGKADNTYIIFTADHGLACGHHGLLGKQNQYEHSVRSPWLIVGPKIPAGKRIEDKIYLQDAMATILDLSGAKKPENYEFESVLPMIAGKSKGRDSIYGSYLWHQRMVINGQYKLIVYPGLKKELLFDLKLDPDEVKDLARCD